MTGQVSVAGFLAARLDEDEDWAKWASDPSRAERWPPFAPRHDPARVLREVAAKRAILALHKPEPMRYIEADRCPRCREPWPCTEARILAAVDSDHPDYRDEWKEQAGA